MSEETQDLSLKQLLERMVEAKQLSSSDAETLIRQWRAGSKEFPQSEEGVLRWLAQEYDVAYTGLTLAESRWPTNTSRFSKVTVVKP